MSQFSYAQPAIGKEGVLLHPASFDFRDTSGVLYGNAMPAPFEAPTGPHIDPILAMRREIISKKLGRDSAVRAVNLGCADGASLLRPDRAQALQLMSDVADQLDARGIPYGYHGHVDIPDLHENEGDLTAQYLGVFRGRPIVVRAAEGLAPHAATVARDITGMVEGGEFPGMHIEGGPEAGGYTMYRRRTDSKRKAEDSPASGTARTQLYGYTFNSGPDRPQDRIVYHDYPTCETHIAVTVMEQVMRGETVVRFIPRTFKQNDYSARLLLDMLGIRNLPVVSVSVGDTGQVNKIIPWSNTGNIDPVVHHVLRSFRSRT